MIVDQIVEPDFESLESALSESQGLDKVLVLFATCTVEWRGNRNGSIGTGQRIILCKPDGAISVHRPNWARAIARQGVNSTLELYPLENGFLLYAGKSKGEHTIHIHLLEVPLVVVYDASDNAEPKHRETEEKMHEFIKSNPEALEDGLRLLHHEYPIDVGTIDFVGADRDGNRVIIEVKTKYAELSHVDQLQRYVKHYNRTANPSVRGLLVAPGFGKKAKRELRENGLEKCRLKKFQHQDLGPNQSSFERWQ
ncbi:endonuclease NucS domain-containing protein [Halorientalis sp.]|uniref:endonuclease NucS domain-containing protein n=1 Tax=Halorientalis sp. TaxID=1931229 RepID=UPI00260DF02F|nr:endonuclease NucS domain-containing protein [Halorientalis sp.]